MLPGPQQLGQQEKSSIFGMLYTTNTLCTYVVGRLNRAVFKLTPFLKHSIGTFTTAQQKQKAHSVPYMECFTPAALCT